MNMITSEKPTLVQLLNRHRVNMIRLAQVAGMPVRVVRDMALNVPVQPILAEQLLDGVHCLTGVYYLLKDVNVALIPPSYVVESVRYEGEGPVAYYASMINGGR